MKMKKVLSKVLKKATESSITASNASMGGWAVEKMPESLSKNR